MLAVTSPDASRTALPHFFLGSLPLRLQPLHEDLCNPEK
jgi:hypothetical protein